MIQINAFTLKMIAIVTMLIDHVGAVCFPQYLILRIIGRIAFPIFAYTLVEGFMHTHDVKKYMQRLGVLAILSEVPFDLAFTGHVFTFEHQNVFFTLFLGILMLYLLLKIPSKFGQFLCILALMLISEFLHTDYSSMGLFLIFCFYRFRDNMWIKSIWVAVINGIFMGGVQIFAVLSLIPISLHSGKQGPKWKGFFYGFYPVHLLILYLIQFLR